MTIGMTYKQMDEIRERLEEIRKLSAYTSDREQLHIALYNENKRLLDENAELRKQLEFSVKLTKALSEDKRPPADTVAKLSEDGMKESLRFRERNRIE